MDQSAKIQPSKLSSGVKTEQPLRAQKYKPKAITIERPHTKWEHMNKTWGYIIPLVQMTAHK